MLCNNCVSHSRLTRKARGWGAASIILERLFSSERTMILLSQSWSRACLLILRLFTSNYQIVTLFLSQARLTKRPDTLDSFNDADVDDYSTQVCLCQVFSLSGYIFVVCHVFTCTCAQDDGGESTEPENQGNTLYFGQQVGKSLINH